MLLSKIVRLIDVDAMHNINTKGIQYADISITLEGAPTWVRYTALNNKNVYVDYIKCYSHYTWSRVDVTLVGGLYVRIKASRRVRKSCDIDDDALF